MGQSIASANTVTLHSSHPCEHINRGLNSGFTAPSAKFALEWSELWSLEDRISLPIPASSGTRKATLSGRILQRSRPDLWVSSVLWQEEPGLASHPTSWSWSWHLKLTELQYYLPTARQPPPVNKDQIGLHLQRAICCANSEVAETAQDQTLVDCHLTASRKPTGIRVFIRKEK